MDCLKDRRCWIAFLALLLLTMSGCTGAAFIGPICLPISTNIAVVHDRAYGPEPSQKLDMYVPADPKSRPMEVIVFFHGGRWTYGTKEDY